MKTLTDLLLLIAAETTANENKLVKYLFKIDTQYNWVSAYQQTFVNEPDIKTIFSSLSIATPEELQLVYWSIYATCRTGRKVISDKKKLK